MLTLQQVREPYYQSADGEQIHIIVKWAEFPEEHPFTATSFDPEQYGRDLYYRAQAGEFGTVAPYVAIASDQPSTKGSQNL